MTVDGIAGRQTLTALAKSLPAVQFKDYSGSTYVKAVQALVGATIDGKYRYGELELTCKSDPWSAAQ